MVQYCHCKDMTFARPSYLYNGNYYTGKASLHWDGPLIAIFVYTPYICIEIEFYIVCWYMCHICMCIILCPICRYPSNFMIITHRWISATITHINIGASLPAMVNYARAMTSGASVSTILCALTYILDDDHGSKCSHFWRYLSWCYPFSHRLYSCFPRGTRSTLVSGYLNWGQ